MSNISYVYPNVPEADVNDRIGMSLTDSVVTSPSLEHKVTASVYELAASAVLTAFDEAYTPADELDFQGRQLIYVESGSLRFELTSTESGGAAIVIAANGDVSAAVTNEPVDLGEGDTLIAGAVHGKLQNPGETATYLQCSKVTVVGPPGCPGNCY